MTRNLTLGIVLAAAFAAACNANGGATSAPTNKPSTPAATPAATPGASVSPTGTDGGAAVVFQPKAGGTPAVTGGASLTEAGGKTKVVITVVSSGTESLAASIQAGTCGSLTPEIAYRLTDVTSGTSTTTVDVELSKLLATPYSINISVLGSETESSVSCGVITVVPAS